MVQGDSYLVYDQLKTDESQRQPVTSTNASLSPWAYTLGMLKLDIVDMLDV